MGLLDGFEHIVHEDEPLAPYTWFRLGGAAKYFAEPTSVDELSELVARFRAEDLPIRVLGGGSRVLVRDEGFAGLVIHLSAPAFCSITVKNGVVAAGGGTKLGHVIATAVRDGLAGLEQLVGIPGTIGGALRGNAGSQGGDIGQWTRSATVMKRTGEILTHDRDDLNFAYRQSSLDELVILNAQFELEPEDPQQLTKRMQKLWIVKKASQPMSNQNTGCIFKDPGGISAASLIDQAGLKGAHVGEAELSERDANFIVAKAGATTSEVLELIEMIRNQVADRLGVELELELQVW